MHEQTSRQAYLKSLIDVIPDKPGVYQYFDKEGKLLYIGKAKNLKKRVSSYFSRTEPSNYKLRVLQKKIANIEHIVVATESDALLLENNLVKKHQPRYNVMLKDDKTFPWICVKNEPFPRVFSTRNVFRDGSVYYGPYTSGLMVKTISSNNIKQKHVQNAKRNPIVHALNKTGNLFKEVNINLT